jgi:hypothetical protein
LAIIAIAAGIAAVGKLNPGELRVGIALWFIAAHLCSPFFTIFLCAG